MRLSVLIGRKLKHFIPTITKVLIDYIDLENDKYEEYPWFRMFYDFEAMQYKSE